MLDRLIVRIRFIQRIWINFNLGIVVLEKNLEIKAKGALSAFLEHVYHQNILILLIIAATARGAEAITAVTALSLTSSQRYPATSLT